VCCWQSGRLCAKPKLSENAFFGKRGIFSVFFKKNQRTTVPNENKFPLKNT